MINPLPYTYTEERHETIGRESGRMKVRVSLSIETKILEEFDRARRDVSRSVAVERLIEAGLGKKSEGE